MIQWHPISELPDALKDGRQLLLWSGEADVGRWSASGAYFGTGTPGWSDVIEGGELSGITHFAEINSPETAIVTITIKPDADWDQPISA